MYAARLGYSDCLELLIKFGACVNERGLSGDTALMQAAEAGHSDIIEILIKAGAF